FYVVFGGGGFQLAQHLVGPPGHAAGQAGQLGHLDAVAVVGRAADDPAQESDVLAPLFDRDVVVFDPLDLPFQVGQLVVMGGEQGLAAQAVLGVGDVLHHRT